MKFYAIVLLYLVQSTPIEQYALKVSHCIVECTSLGEAEQRDSCLDQCNIWAACSGPSLCSLRCSLNDTGCHKACNSFTNTPDCSNPCNTTTLNSSINNETLSMTANVSSTANHVIFLDQIENNALYAVNFTIDDDVTFIGLYPGKLYRARVIVFDKGICCTEVGHVTEARYSVTTPHISSSNNSNSNNISSSNKELFLAPDLIEMFRDNKTYLNSSWNIDKEPILFPEYIAYDMDSDSYDSFESNLRSSHDPSFLRYRRSDLNKIPASEMKRAKPYRLGAGYIVRVYPDNDKTVEFYPDDSGQSTKMIPLSTEFCTFVPNEQPNITTTIQPSGACVNTTLIPSSSGENISYITFLTDALVNVQTCYKSRETNGSIENTPCCKGNVLSCLYNEGRKTVAQFQQSYDYLLYINEDHLQCKNDRPCSGVFQRLNPSQMEHCKDEAESQWIIWVLILMASCTLTIFTATLAIWFYCRPPPKPIHPNRKFPPNRFDLDRNKIIKIKLIGRGNFGLVFEGKLIVSGGFDFEGETSMDDEVNVAIKILKVSNADEEEHREAREAMRAEINLMKKMQEDGRSNRNVLEMIGCVVDASPYMMILELCSVNLKVYLRNHRVQIEDQEIDAEKLHSLSIQERPESAHQLIRRTATDPGGTAGVTPTSLLFNRYSDRGDNTHYMDSKKGRMTMSSPSTGSYKGAILSRKKMLEFCMQVAKGMEFLHSIDILHRDIAASNILVQINDDDVVLKICDFGQSKELYKGGYTIANNVAAQRKMFRLRWTAPEVIANSAMWSKESDVWSYGVLMWEVFTLGGTPYPGWPDYTIQSSLVAGHRMTCPPVCSADIFEIMTNCWSQCPTKRRSFLDIKEKSETMVMDEYNAGYGIGANDYYAFPIDQEVDPERDLEAVPAEDKDIDIREIDIGSGKLLDEEFVVSVAFNNNSVDEAEVVIDMNM